MPLRGKVVLAPLLLLAALSFADDAAGGAAANGAAAEDDDDFVFDDDDDVEESGGQAFGAGPGGPGGAPPVDDFDLGMPEQDQKLRMKACFGHTMTRAQTRQSELEAGVKEITQVHQDKITPEQALNTLVFSWMMSCYMNIDDGSVAKVHLSPEEEQEAFMPRSDRPQQVNQASRRQWQLLESVVMDEQKNRESQRGRGQQQQSQGGPARGPGVDLPGKSMSGQSQAIYILVVFGVFFGGAALIVLRLMKSEVKDDEKERKSAKKADKKLKGKKA